MAAPITAAHPILAPDVQGRSMKKWLLARLIGFGEQLDAVHAPDAITREFVIWVDKFIEALDLQVDPTVVREQFFQLMRDHLGALCSFVVAYGNTTVPTELVRDLIQWIQSEPDRLTAVDRSMHAALLNHFFPPAPHIPTREEKLQAIRARTLAAVQQRTRELEAHRVQIQREVAVEVQERIAPLLAEMKEAAAEAQQRVEQLQRDDQARFAAMERMIERSNVQNALEEHVSNRIDLLERRLADLKKQNVKLDSQLSNLERDNQKLQVLIAEVQASIAKQEKSWFGKFMTTLLVTGACMLATYGFGGPTIFPFDKGLGAGIKFAI